MSNRLLYQTESFLALCNPQDWVRQRHAAARRGDIESVDTADTAPLTQEEFDSLPGVARIAAVLGDPDNKFNGDRNRAQYAASCAIERAGLGHLHYRYLLDAKNCPWIAQAIMRNSDGTARPNHLRYAAKQVADSRAEAGSEHVAAEAAAKPARSPLSLAPFCIADLQPTPWLVYGLLLRRAVTVVAAAGGTGKTQLTIQAAIAWALGEDFAGWRPMRPLRVAFISGEEPVDELQRRIAASILDRGESFEGTMKALDGRLYTFDTKNIALVEKDAEGVIRRTALFDSIQQLVKEKTIDIVVVDPTIRAHSGLDENSAEMQNLHNAADAIAVAGNCAVMLVHHIRKSSRGNVDDQSGVRGASALVDASRVTLMLANMTPEEAKEILPAEEQPHYAEYVKYKDPKQNYGPTSPVRWFRKVGVELPIKLEDGTADVRMVLRPWAPAADGGVLQAPWLNKFLNALEQGPQPGEFYTAATSGPRAGRADALLESYGVPKGKLREALRELTEAGLVAADKHDSPKAKRPVNVIKVRGRTPKAQAEIPF